MWSNGPDAMAGNDHTACPVFLGDVVRSSSGVVVAAHPQAASAGAEILANGGNAIDAAVGTAFALAVVEPEASGLGGGGFLLYYDAPARSCVSIDYRETAPARSTELMYAIDGPGMPDNWEAPETLREQAALQRIGGSAVGVPRMVAGLFQAHALYGRLPLTEVLAPAIRLAEEGFLVSDAMYSAVLNVYDALLNDDAMAAAFLNDYLPYEPGETARRPDLAATFREILAQGAEAFYRGGMAKDIVDSVQRAGGILDAADLADVRIEISDPMETTYHDVRLMAPGLPSGGLAVFETLGILDAFELGAATPLADRVHWIAEATKRVFADRAAFLGDPKFVDVPTAELLSPAWAALRRASIDPAEATPNPAAGLFEPASTSHVSVIDAQGRAVSLTQSISLFFGSQVFVPEWGILLNNTMADFDPEPGTPNSVAPGKTPMSSMCPLLLFDSEGLRAVLGTPGGMRITSTLVELTVAFIDRGLPLSDAILEPRFHAETDVLHLESRFADDVLSELVARGHPLDKRGTFDLYFGGAHLIEIERDGAETVYVGVADPRRAGQAAGL